MKDKLPKIGYYDNGWKRTGILQLEVEQGYASPFWYGLAWWSPIKNVAVCYPIPLNWLFWGLREVYWFLNSTPHHYKHPLWKEGYKQGYDYGMACGLRKGYEDAKLDFRLTPSGMVYSVKDIQEALYKENFKSST